MTDVINISFSSNTTILSTITTAISTNISTDMIAAMADRDPTMVTSTVESPMPIWLGFIGCIIASLFFGSNLVPIKQFSAGDGFFFQFIFCVAVHIVGLIVDLIIGNQRFYPLVVIGGVLWTTGNLFTVFCIKTCGLAVGLLIWGTASLTMGWASGRFGFFGVTPQIPRTTTKLVLNYASVVLAAISAMFFVFIKSTNTRPKPRYGTIHSEKVSIEIIKTSKIVVETKEILETDFPCLNQLNYRVQKVLGCVSAVIAGSFYGTIFIPDQYIRDHPDMFIYKNNRPSKNGLYYVSSQYSGILLSSLFYFIIYAILKRNRPAINPSIVLPAMLSGAMWAIANIGFIIAISALKSAVAYPIVSVLPGIVTSLWSLFWFKEIQGKKNYIILGCGMIVRCIAALLSGLSA